MLVKNKGKRWAVEGEKNGISYTVKSNNFIAKSVGPNPKADFFINVEKVETQEQAADVVARLVSMFGAEILRLEK